MIAIPHHDGTYRGVGSAKSSSIRHRPPVCQVLHGLSIGGAEILASRIAYRLSEQYAFTFICLDCLGELGEQLVADGFPVRVLARRPGLDWRCAWQLGRFIRESGARLIHAHQYTPFFYAALARTIQPRVPILFTEHGRWFPDYPRRKRIVANRVLLSRKDRVVGVGECVRQALVANEGIRLDRIRLIYNGIDINPIANATTKSDRQAVRAELGCSNEELLVVKVARFDYLKDHHTAVRAMGHLAHQGRSIRLVCVGDGTEREFIQAHVKQASLEKQVSLIGCRRDVGRLLAAADMLLLTSLSEGIPLTLLEGMAAGLPVVATKVGGVPEVVEHGVTGLLVPAGDDQAVAEAILQLAANPEQRQSLGAAGRDRADRLFGETRMCDAYRELYDEMLGA